MRRGEAGSLSDHAIDIDDEVARTTHEMVVIVPDAPFVASYGSGRLNAPDESDLGEGAQRVVDCLMRDIGEVLADSMNDGFSIRMLIGAYSIQNCNPLLGHAQGAVPQCRGRIRFGSLPVLSHRNSLTLFLE